MSILVCTTAVDDDINFYKCGNRTGRIKRYYTILCLTSRKHVVIFRIENANQSQKKHWVYRGEVVSIRCPPFNVYKLAIYCYVRTLCFAWGFSLFFGKIKIRTEVEVVLTKHKKNRNNNR